MRGSRRQLVAVALFCCLAVGAWPASASGATTYGPSWGRFTVQFPSTPTESGNLAKQLTTVKGAVAGYGFAVSHDKDLFDASSTGPTVPTYEVVSVQFTTASAASSAIATVHKDLSSSTQVAVGGAKGFKAFGSVPAAAATEGHAATKAYTLGVEFLTRGTTGYQVVVATRTSKAAEAFVSTFRPVP
jgi:hypothetical protein